MTDDSKRQLHVHVSPELKEEIGEAARRDSRSLSAWVRLALAHEAKRQLANDPAAWPIIDD